jgi:hypothetical protein
MAKPKHSLRLYAKPEKGKTFGELDFKWLADNDPIPQGFKRVKKLKEGVDYEETS